MRTLFFTIASGDKALQHYDVAGECFRQYARRHGMDYLCITDVTGYREPHYAKTYVLKAFNDGYECVVYFDVDGVLDVNAPDIRDGLEPSGIHIYNELDLVESYHKNPVIRDSFKEYCDAAGVAWDGSRYFNSGVFVAFPDAACILDIADMEPGRWCHEQHCINLQILRFPHLVHELPERWNYHRLQFKQRINGALSGECWFAHMAGYAARGKDNGIALMKQIKANMKRRSQRRVIIVAKTGEYDDVAALTIPKLTKYAQKCNAELIVLDGLPKKYKHPKYRMFEAAHIDADRLLIIDADIVVRDNAPDIFEAFPEGNYMLNEQMFRERSAFAAHRQEIRRRATAYGLYDVTLANNVWWNPGVALLDRQSAWNIYQLPPWDFTAPEMLYDVGNGRRIVKNMPWINWRIAANSIAMNALPQEWNTFVNKITNLKWAHFWHCAGSEADAQRDKNKIAMIKDVCRRFKEPLDGLTNAPEIMTQTKLQYHVRFVPACKQAWILEKMQAKIMQYAPAHVSHSVGQRIDEPGVINHMLYRHLGKAARHALDVVFCTHPEEEPKFWEAAKEADHAVVMNRQYRDAIIATGVPAENVTLIYPGVDECYRNARLRVFNPSRMGYAQGRKGDALWTRLTKLPWLECICSQGRMTDEEVLRQYERADAIVSTATMEGGPMAVLEGLAMGKTVIARKGVGLVNDFGGVLRYDDDNGLIEILKTIHDEIRARQGGIIDLTWERYAAEHWALFYRLATERGLRYQQQQPLPPSTPTQNEVRFYSAVPREISRLAQEIAEAKGLAVCFVPQKNDSVIDMSDMIGFPEMLQRREIGKRIKERIQK